MGWIYTNDNTHTDPKQWEVVGNQQIDENIKKINNFNNLRGLYYQKQSDENIRQAEDKKFWDSQWAQFLAPFWRMYQKITNQDVNPVAYLNPNYREDSRDIFERDAEIKDIKNQVDNFDGKMNMASSQTLMWQWSGSKNIRVDLTWKGGFSLQNPDVDEYLDWEKGALENQLKSYNMYGKLSDAEKKDMENIKQTLAYINQLQSWKTVNTTSSNTWWSRTPTPSRTSTWWNVNQDIVTRVIRWEFGNGNDRKNAVEALWYNYDEVRNAVNQYLGGNKNVQIPQPTVQDTNTIEQNVNPIEQKRNTTLQNWQTYNDFFYEKLGNYINNPNSFTLQQTNVLMEAAVDLGYLDALPTNNDSVENRYALSNARFEFDRQNDFETNEAVDNLPVLDQEKEQFRDFLFNNWLKIRNGTIVNNKWEIIDMTQVKWLRDEEDTNKKPYISL